MSNTIFVAAGGISPIEEPMVKKNSDQISDTRFLPTIFKNSCNSVLNDRVRSRDRLPESKVGMSPVATGSLSRFLNWRNLNLLDLLWVYIVIYMWIHFDDRINLVAPYKSNVV